MVDNIVTIAQGNMPVQSAGPDGTGSVPPAAHGSRARPVRKDEAEHAELLFSLFEKHLLGTQANAKRTVAIAMGALGAFSRYVGQPPWEWTEQDLDEFLAHKVVADGIGLGRQSTYITYLRAFQTYLLDSLSIKNEIHRRFGKQPQRFVTQENAVAIKRKRYERRQEIRPLTAQQCDKLIDTYDCQIKLAEQSRSKAFNPLRRDRVMITLMLLTGIRVDELVNLKTTDWLPDSGQPQFGAYALLSVFGKGRKRRIVRLINPLVRIVMEWYIQDVRPVFLSVNTPDPTLLFLSERGRPLCTEQVRRSLRDIAALAAIPFRVKPHMLRHTYATLMKDILGAEGLRHQLGHEYLSTTYGTYCHANPQNIGDEVARAITIFSEAINRTTAEIDHEDHA